MKMGEKIRRKREEAGISQEQLGEKLGVSFQAVSNWERNSSLPDTAKLSMLAKALNTSVSYLMGEAGSQDWDRFDRLFDEDRMYTFIKAAATAKGLHQTLQALPFAREKHKNQIRKGKACIPYISHPLTMCCQALALGLDEDDLLSATLLHDVVEDCEVSISELPVEETAQETVRLLSKDKSHELDEEGYDKGYFEAIATSPHAMLVKLLDRCHNLSVMASGFDRKRMGEYVTHTQVWVMPLADRLREMAPQYSNACFLLKYQMLSLMYTVQHLLGE
ncbi:MAG: XRE family transcriptional regulator [Bacillota bacterium]|nr:XRE family transcriptional regulator [Bacillota bacterium]